MFHCHMEVNVVTLLIMSLTSIDVDLKIIHKKMCGEQLLFCGWHSQACGLYN